MSDTVRLDVGLPHQALSSMAWCRRLLLIAPVIGRLRTRRMGNWMGAMMAMLTHTAI
jgi:hypothetical protein